MVLKRGYLAQRSEMVEGNRSHDNRKLEEHIKAMLREQQDQLETEMTALRNLIPTRFSRMDFPKFNGEYFRGWLYKSKQFFEVDETPPALKVKMAAVNLEGTALQWYQVYMEVQGLKQTGTMLEYQEQFEELLNTLDLPEDYATSYFLSGLKPEIQLTVRMFMPKNVAHVNDPITKRCQMSHYWKNNSHAGTSNHQWRKNAWPLLPTSSVPALPSIGKGNEELEKRPHRRLTRAEMDNKGAKGLCFWCDEKFGMGHRCGNKQFHRLEIWDDQGDVYEERGDESVEEEVDDREARGGNLAHISINVMTSMAVPNFRIMMITGHVGKQLVNIHIDSGSSHNFIHPNVIQRKCKDKSSKLIYWYYQWEEWSQSSVEGNQAIGIAVDQEEKMQQVLQKPSQIAASQLCLIRAVVDHTKENAEILTVTATHKGDQTQEGSALDQLLKEYDDLFQEPTELPPKRLHDHRIPLKEGTHPISVRPYRPSSSPYSSPVVLVKKNDGSWRMCIDYRTLNQATTKNKFPIPLSKELLDELIGAKYFSKLDLRSSYHRIRMCPEDIHKIAFKTHDGHYEFLVMPFGLTNAPSSFQNLMNDVFKPFLKKFLLVFFDDILIYSQTWADYMIHLRKVFETLRANTLKVKLSKCAFAKQQVNYLGHVITSEGVQADLQKIAAI
nr:uncharacterized protein LOC113716000 [Coffea arabica]